MRYLSLSLAVLIAACGSDATEPPKATTLEIVAGDGQTGTVGSPLAQELSVRVLDQNGDPLPGVDVTWSVTEGDGSVEPATARTDVSGVASTQWTLGTASGEQSVSASSPGLETATFSAEAEADAPDGIEFLFGTDQLAIAGDPLAAPVVVRVVDQYDNPVSGAEVTFAVTAGDATANPGTATTDAAGVASVQLSISDVAGLNDSVVLGVEAADVAASVTFYVRRPVLLFHREDEFGYYHVIAMDWIAGTEQPLTGEDEHAGGGSDLSPDGSVLAVSLYNFTSGMYDLQLRDLATGEVTTVFASAGADATYPRFSPDGSALTFTVTGAATQTVATYDIERGALTVDEPDAGVTSYSAYTTPESLVFSAAYGGQFDLVVRDLLSDFNVRITSTGTEAEYWPDAMAPDRFVFVCAPLDGTLTPVQRDLCAIDVDGSDRVKFVDAPDWDDTYPTISYDGAYVAFAGTPLSGDGAYSIYYASTEGGDILAIRATTAAHETMPSFGILGWDPAPAVNVVRRNLTTTSSAGARLPVRMPRGFDALTVPRTGGSGGVQVHPGRALAPGGR
ncbi:MAG TPA: Ig-like domain-containing protein [Longimicrobiales bacterium]